MTNYLPREIVYRLETYVAQNLASLLEAHVPNAQLAYWHEQGRHEVDFVIEAGRKVFAIEVKAATRWVAGVYRQNAHLRRCRARLQRPRGSSTG